MELPFLVDLAADSWDVNLAGWTRFERFPRFLIRFSLQTGFKHLPYFLQSISFSFMRLAAAGAHNSSLPNEDGRPQYKIQCSLKKNIVMQQLYYEIQLLSSLSMNFIDFYHEVGQSLVHFLNNRFVNSALTVSTTTAFLLDLVGKLPNHRSPPVQIALIPLFQNLYSWFQLNLVNRRQCLVHRERAIERRKETQIDSND